MNRNGFDTFRWLYYIIYLLFINDIKYPCNIPIFVSWLPKPKIFTFSPFKRMFAKVGLVKNTLVISSNINMVIKKKNKRVKCQDRKIKFNVGRGHD